MTKKELAARLRIASGTVHFAPAADLSALLIEAADALSPDEPGAGLTYSQACDLLAQYAVALHDRQCCGHEMQPQYMAALKACTDAMGVQPENRAGES